MKDFFEMFYLFLVSCVQLDKFCKSKTVVKVKRKIRKFCKKKFKR